MCSFNNELLTKNKDFEFYFGIWNIENVAFFDTDVLVNNPEVSCLQGANYFLASSTFNSVSGAQSLFSVNEDKSTNLDPLLFRGYILQPPIHSLSEKNRIRAYWKDEFCKQHNGVFSAVAIINNGKALEMTTDVFGIGSLYYRKLGSAVAFATSPRFLSCDGDKQDLVSWRCLMQSGFIPGDNSLSVEIKRVPPGTVLTFTADKVSTQCWFDYEKFPEGTQPITPTAVDNVEGAFSTAMQRCLKLDICDRLLPLSSGYDSRRILSYLLDEKVCFESETVQIPDAQNQDVDAYFSALMARDFNFSHKIHEMPSDADLLFAEEVRRFCLDYESMMHAWFLPLWRKPTRSTLVFEGLCGDTLGHSGLKISGIGNDYKPDREWLAERLMMPSFDSVLNHKVWPSNEEVITAFGETIKLLPETNNLIDLVMILHRARRAVSISSQQFVKPGHVVVYPYLDLDYIHELLRYHPLERYQNSFQAQCLRKYHTGIYMYFGSHNIPENTFVPFLKKCPNDQCFKNDKDMLYSNMKPVRRNLTLKRQLMLTIAMRNMSFLDSNNWWINHIIEYEKRGQQPPFF